MLQACFNSGKRVEMRDLAGRKNREQAARNFTVELKFSLLIEFSPLAASANLPCYGLFVDPVAVCLRFFDGKVGGMRVLRCAKGK
jgi:hypothetical protein